MQIYYVAWANHEILFYVFNFGGGGGGGGGGNGGGSNGTTPGCFINCTVLSQQSQRFIPASTS